MGGFHLFERSTETSDDDGTVLHEEDTPLYPLGWRDLLDKKFESFTMPTKAEIKDRGKSDWLAKSLVLLQTSWFVLQCIARGVEHLPVTHLEIVTLAYAAMNFVIYIFWWNKPLNVNRPIRVFRKSGPRETQPQVTEPISRVRNGSVETILDFILGFQDEGVNLSRKDRVPRFWANSTDRGDVGIADMIVLAVGVCFGAIHCIAWLFSFPTHTELLIWRISSVAITAVPIYVPFMLLFGFCLGDEGPNDTFAYYGPLFGGILYIIARAVTLVLAFISLRELPPGAYETVHWTTFIPHV